MELDHFQIKGLPVFKAYYEGEVMKVTNGLFEISNTSDVDVTASLQHVSVIAATDKLEIGDCHIYLLPEYVEVPLEKVKIEADSKIQLDISFPFVRLKNQSAQPVNVQIKLKILDQIFVVKSPNRFTIRTRKSN